MVVVVWRWGVMVVSGGSGVEVVMVVVVWR